MVSQRGGMVVLLCMVLVSTTAHGADDGIGARLAAIEADQKATLERYSHDLQRDKLTGAAQKPATDRYLKEVNRNVEAALDLARDHPEDPAAFLALQFVIRTNRAGPGDGTARALRMILDRGYDRRPDQGDYLAHVGLVLFRYPDAETLLRGVLDHNPNRDDRASACYWLAHQLSQKTKIIRRLRERPEDRASYERYKAAEPVETFIKAHDPDVLDRESEALLERAGKEFGDARLFHSSRPLREIVDGELFAIRNLGVGKTAPEIEGRDHEGKTFRLSETRGKVVLLTFSGQWCGACVAMYPQERALVKKLKDRPFAMVSVNTDDDVETLRKAIDAGDITWRCWWERGTDGPITTHWGITGFPSIFVLDRRGVIRFKNLRGVELDRAIESLLDEPSASTKPD